MCHALYAKYIKPNRVCRLLTRTHRGFAAVSCIALRRTRGQQREGGGGVAGGEAAAVARVTANLGRRILQKPDPQCTVNYHTYFTGSLTAAHRVPSSSACSALQHKSRSSWVLLYPRPASMMAWWVRYSKKHCWVGRHSLEVLLQPRPLAQATEMETVSVFRGVSLGVLSAGSWSTHPWSTRTAGVDRGLDSAAGGVASGEVFDGPTALHKGAGSALITCTRRVGVTHTPHAAAAVQVQCVAVVSHQSIHKQIKPTVLSQGNQSMHTVPWPCRMSTKAVSQYPIIRWHWLQETGSVQSCIWLHTCGCRAHGGRCIDQRCIDQRCIDHHHDLTKQHLYKGATSMDIFTHKTHNHTHRTGVDDWAVDAEKLGCAVQQLLALPGGCLLLLTVDVAGGTGGCLGEGNAHLGGVCDGSVCVCVCSMVPSDRQITAFTVGKNINRRRNTLVIIDTLVFQHKKNLI